LLLGRYFVILLDRLLLIESPDQRGETRRIIMAHSSLTARPLLQTSHGDIHHTVSRLSPIDSAEGRRSAHECPSRTVLVGEKSQAAHEDGAAVRAGGTEAQLGTAAQCVGEGSARESPVRRRNLGLSRLMPW